MLPDGRVVIGWREFVALPDWGVEAIRAKADTGARTGAVDVTDLEELPDNRVRFTLNVNRRTGERRTIEAEVVRRTRVRSSFGQARDRVLVRTTMRLGSVEKTIELGLVSRRNMLCRLLVGRAALEPEFLVDSAHRYVFGRARRSRPPGERA